MKKLYDKYNHDYENQLATFTPKNVTRYPEINLFTYGIADTAILANETAIYFSNTENVRPSYGLSYIPITTYVGSGTSAHVITSDKPLLYQTIIPGVSPLSTKTALVTWLNVTMGLTDYITIFSDGQVYKGTTFLATYTELILGIQNGISIKEDNTGIWIKRPGKLTTKLQTYLPNNKTRYFGIIFNNVASGSTYSLTYLNTQSSELI